MSTSQNRHGALAILFRTTVLIVSAFLLTQFISLYLSWPKQMVLGLVSVFLGLVINRLSSSRVVTIGLMLVSMTATLRYAWWRSNLLIDFFSDQSNNRFGIDAAFMLILIGAEAYTILIMVLGYMQTVWPLHRKPVPLPGDESLWPHVDVLIPTYNEPLSLVRYTALAAINMDYPPEKLHVYILDDGTRGEFKEFAEMAGVGYVTRVEHKHAKAGNINHALSTMDSEFVTIFDCDHVPTRSFLQVTLGWMLVDRNLAMLQTPHHFYSPDPFERNLLQYKTIPNEAELFYGIVQDGNDFWNATFFCGSCALIRRSALNSVGGIATETVTEDAHTSLRMQKRGWNTAYINIPQAAGLATETLAAHVGQRIRWARGMIQIFRTDNPLLAKGMKFTQRLCYLNAMIHFLYAVPRLVFLGAPLVYMLLGRTIIPGYWVAILAYAIPHLILSSMTNSRIQGRHRHSFWNEIYEAVLAPYILAPTLFALVNPKLGKFNVTDKGSTLSQTHFDGKIATPTKWILLLNLLGVLVAPYRMFVKDPSHPGTVIMNLVWIFFNMVILGVAAAVAHEQKQRRSSVRIEARIPVRIDLPDGRQVLGKSIDMSIGGASIKLAEYASFAVGDTFRIAFPEHAGDEQIGAKVVGTRNGELRLAFLVPSIAEQETLTKALYSRADAWISSLEAKEVDRPLLSLWRVINLSLYGVYQILRSYLPQKPPAAKPRAAETAALLLLVGVLGFSHPAAAFNQAAGLSYSVDASGKVHARSTAPAPDAKRSVKPGPVADQAALPSSDENTGISQSITLKDMGLAQQIEMRGPHSYSTASFMLSHSMVPRQATLKLIYSFVPGLDPAAASLKITLNGTSIATVAPPPGSDPQNGNSQINLPVPEDLLVRSNSLAFEFNGAGVLQREDQAAARILGHISPKSTLEVSGDRLHWPNDLSQLPLPFFDSELQTETVVPVVFLTQPTLHDLEAAGIVASWLGIQASSKPIRFSVTLGQIPAGNSIVFSESRSLLPAALQIPAGTGPFLALRDNPSDQYASVLVIAGDDEQQLLAAARTLSLTRKATAGATAQGLALSGDFMPIPDLVMPPARVKEDAPRWLPATKTAPLASCQAQDALQSDGSVPVPVYFHVPPDLFYGEKQNIKLHLFYRYSARQVAPRSALRVVVNGELVNEIPLPPGTDTDDKQRTILVPVAALRPFGNTLLFNFDFVPANRDALNNPGAGALKGQILCNSTLDLEGLDAWARMPNLELFANAGFPFTQFADLSETTVVLPIEPGAQEISLYLHLMSHFGEQTGYPALRVSVAGPNTVLSGSRDYLVLGTIASQPAFNSLEGSLPVTVDSSGIHVKPIQSYLSPISSIQVTVSNWWAGLMGTPTRRDLPSTVVGMPDALVEGLKSPSSPDRSIILIALKDAAAADTFANVFLDRSSSGDLTGSVSLLLGSRFDSYPIDAETYHVGNISWLVMLRIWLTQYFILLLLAVTMLSFLVARWTREWLSDRAHERLKLAETAGSVR